jgi:hypothetical protein
VEVLLDGKYQRLVVRYSLYFVSPFSRNLDCCLHGFSTSVHRQDHIEAEHLGDEFREFREDVVVEGSAAQRQARSLFCQRLDQFRVAMALVHSAVGR